MKRGNAIMRPVYSVASWFGRNHPETMIRLRYFLRFHKFPNLNTPKTLNEKIIWLSLRTDTAKWSELADKYSVREYVKKQGLEDALVKLYGVWSSASEIDFDKLPDAFVLKPTHGSGNIVIVRDKNLVDRRVLTNFLNECLSAKYGELEGGKHYFRITPRIVAEELLQNDEVSARYSESIVDYKVWCFDGRATYVWACVNRDCDGASVMLYDLNWNAHPEYCIFTSHYRRSEILPQPQNLGKMIEVAEKLSKGFPVVRVDLYNIAGRVFFGEMTFTSLGGMMDFYTEEFQQLAGDMITLPGR